MIRKIYHGSAKIVERPLYGLSKRYNDYGQGFYCTDNLEMAKEWGVSFEKDGYANCYEIDCNGLDILNLNDGKHTVLHWLALLLENREFDAPSGLAFDAKNYLLKNFLIDYSHSDVIIGYRADNSYFSFAQDFINGTISYRQLNHAMHLGQLGQQFVLKSEEAFSHIRFLGAECAECSQWLAKKELRDKSTRRQYFDFTRNNRQRNDLYITQILDEEVKANDPRL